MQHHKYAKTIDLQRIAYLTVTFTLHGTCTNLHELATADGEKSPPPPGSFRGIFLLLKSDNIIPFFADFSQNCRLKCRICDFENFFEKNTQNPLHF